MNPDYSLFSLRGFVKKYLFAMIYVGGGGGGGGQRLCI